MHDAIVVGAGPTGLMLACQLARRHLDVRLFEQAPGPRPFPRAIGVSVPTLEIFRDLGLDAALVARGVPVRHVTVHGRRRVLGGFDFRNLGSDFDFILSVPQDRVADVLREGLRRQAGMTPDYGHRVTGFREDGDRVAVQGQRADGSPFEAEARYVVACDGPGSTLRTTAGIGYPGAYYADTFLMADFPDATGWGAETHVWFTPMGSVEAFPLPDGMRRFVVSTPGLVTRDEETVLKAAVLARTGTDLGPARMQWKMAFKVRHQRATRYTQGRLALVGDAAHVMSPIVGQNMNTGFADAELLAVALERVLRRGADAAAWFRFYEDVRVAAARAATSRARFVMGLGASGGALWSPLRNGIFAAVLHSPLRRRLPPLFSMMSIPHRNLRGLGAPMPGPE